MGNRGAVLWELVWVLGWAALLVTAHLHGIRQGIAELRALEGLRLPYDGVSGRCDDEPLPLPWGRR